MDSNAFTFTELGLGVNSTQYLFTTFGFAIGESEPEPEVPATTPLSAISSVGSSHSAAVGRTVTMVGNKKKHGPRYGRLT